MQSQLTRRTVRHATFHLESEEEVRAMEVLLLAAQHALGHDELTASLPVEGERTAALRAARDLVGALQGALAPNTDVRPLLDNLRALRAAKAKPEKVEKPAKGMLFGRRRRKVRAGV